MRKQKENLTFTFHNPNIINEKYIDALLDVFIEANKGKVERAIQESAMQAQTQPPKSAKKAPAKPAPKKSILKGLTDNQKIVDEYKRESAGKTRAPIQSTERD